MNLRVDAMIRKALLLFFCLMIISCDQNVIDAGNSGIPDKVEPITFSFNGRIFFSDLYENESYIFELDGSTGNYRRIFFSFYDHMPTIAQDRMTFISRNNLRFYGIYQHNFTTGGYDQFLFNVDVNYSFAQINQTNTTIAFVKDLKQVVLRNIQSQVETPIFNISGSGRIQGLHWNPINDDLLFFVDQSSSNGIYQFNQGTGITSFLIEGRYPHMNSTGQKILYDRNGRIYEYTIQSATHRDISGSRNASNPVYSPNETQIAYRRLISGKYNIEISDLNGNNRKTVDYPGNQSYLFWVE